MSQVSQIADYFLSPTAASAPRRIALIGVGDAVPVSFLTACLGRKWAAGGKRVMAVDGRGGDRDLASLLRQELPASLEGKEPTAGKVPLLSEISVVSFSLTSDALQHMASPSQWERFKHQEVNADLLLSTMPADATLLSWAPIVRSFHAVVLLLAAGEKDLPRCYRVVRFLYHHNPFLQVHLVRSLVLEKETSTAVSDSMNFYEQLFWMVARFLRQDLMGPHLFFADPSVPESRSSSFDSCLEHLSQKLLTAEPSLGRNQFPAFFESLEAVHSTAQASRWEKADLFKQLPDYWLLDDAVGPKKATLLLNWERRLAVGETVTGNADPLPGVGDALMRGIEVIDWARDHLPLLARLYGKQLDPALPPHLILISPDYPPAFCNAVTHLGLPIILYKTCRGNEGNHFVPVFRPPGHSLAPDLSSEEEDALKNVTLRGKKAGQV